MFAGILLVCALGSGQPSPTTCTGVMQSKQQYDTEEACNLETTRQIRDIVDPALKSEGLESWGVCVPADQAEAAMKFYHDGIQAARAKAI